MRALPACYPLVALLVSTSLSQPAHGAALPTGSYLAAAAAELRWERGAAWALGLWLLAQGLPRAAAARHPALSAAALWLQADDEGPARWRHLAPAPALWGAPAHLALALGCAATCLWGGRAARPLSPAPLPAATLLLGLGLGWNLAQAGGQQGWAWDWIEAAPPALIVALAWQRHRWAAAPAPALVAGYLGLLQVSRASLLASAHHLQLPAAPLPASHVSVAAAGAAAAAGAWLLLPALRARPRRLRRQGGRLRWPQAAWEAYPHASAASAASLALAPVWASGGWSPAAALAFGFAGRGPRRPGQRAALKWSPFDVDLW